ncbi:sucrase ferredoxin [Leifsonia flava]|uniref:sucrase ferredoxin n=1 Tax=Orlajensenia leifsoniae TaxID=2561933 RepID=UPI0019571420|nr:sucrase ferredoxin [Leifsonia flava]
MSVDGPFGDGGWQPCSDRSRQRGDPLTGTGSRGMQWFLIEISGPWGSRAFLDPPFDTTLGRALIQRIEGAGMRPLAIRRTGRRREQTSWSWASVDSRPGHESVRWGSVDNPEELLDVPLDGSTGEASDRPIFAVCAHARHDQCCAVRGRQVVTTLAAAFPEETWECSHLGGDRFAGTLVMLPHGLYYGNADDGDAVRIAEAYLDGRVVEEHYRGRSSLSHPVQAAQHYARLALGDEGIEAYPPLSERETTTPEGGSGWTVSLGTDAGPVTVELAESASDPLLSTCSATRQLRVRQYELAGLTGPAAIPARGSSRSLRAERSDGP